MKPILLLTAAAVFTFTACDGEKAQEAKQKTVEAGKAVGDAAKAGGEAIKEIGGKAVQKAKEELNKAKDLAGAAGQIIKDKSSPAMETFKAKIGGLSEWFGSMKEKAGNDPGKAKQIMNEMLTRLQAISAEGLPADLKQSFGTYQGAMTRLQQLVRTMPADTAAAEKWVNENVQRLHQLEVETTDAQKALKETAAKHGITGLDLGSVTE